MQASKSKPATGTNELIIGKHAELIEQFNIVREFFQTDNATEMIESIHAMSEAFLYTEGLANLTPKMKDDLVNNLRIATLLSRLDKNYRDIIS